MSGTVIAHPPAPAQRRIAALLAVLALFAAAGARSHEIDSNRVTIVQREPQHFALTFYVDYVELLRRTLAPSATLQEFATACAALPDERLRRQLLAAHTTFEKALDVRTAAGAPLRVGPLRWPGFEPAQRLLRDAAMRAVVDPAAHGTGPPVEVSGDAVAPAPVDELRVTLPRVLGGVVVVSYRPEQRWIDAERGRAFAVRY